MVSLKDVAQSCGVSVATVSKALNGQQDIGKETRARVLEAADKLEFERAAFLRDQIKKLKAHGPQPADGKRGKKK